MKTPQFVKSRTLKNKTCNNSQSGNAAIIGLVALVVLAVAALAYTSGYLTGDEKKADNMVAAPDAASTETANAVQAPAPQQEIDIEPGNPVVAKIGEDEITRMDIFNFIQTLPPQTRQLPMQQLFPMATAQVVNMRLVNEKSQKAKIDNDPLVKERLEAAKREIIPAVYLQRAVEKAIDEERLQSAYDTYTRNFPQTEEVKARHILVEDETKATDLIKQLSEGGSFEELAKEHSTDTTSENGGLLGYFVQAEVVPEFGSAAFTQEIGAVSEKPIKSQFGYHIIKVEEKRMRPPASFEQAKPFLQGQLRQIVTNEIVQKWRDEAGVVVFDINGNDIEPASGESDEEAEKE